MNTADYRARAVWAVVPPSRQILDIRARWTWARYIGLVRLPIGV